MSTIDWRLAIDWENPEAVIREVMRRLGERRDRLSHVPVAAVRRGVFELQAIVQRNIAQLRRTPGAGSSTPTMVRSVTVRIDEEADPNQGSVSRFINRVRGRERVRVVGTVGTFLLLLLWLERGTGIHGPLKRPYEIRPKKKAGLFWGAYTPDGRPIIRKKVIHPGIKPRRPFARAAAEYLPQFVDLVEREVRKEAGR